MAPVKVSAAAASKIPPPAPEPAGPPMPGLVTGEPDADRAAARRRPRPASALAERGVVPDDGAVQDVHAAAEAESALTAVAAGPPRPVNYRPAVVSSMPPKPPVPPLPPCRRCRDSRRGCRAHSSVTLPEKR